MTGFTRATPSCLVAPMPAQSWSVCRHRCGGRPAASAASATRRDISAKRRGETQTPIHPSPSRPVRAAAASERPPTEDGNRRLRRRPDGGRLDGEEPAVEADLLAGQEGPQQPQRLVRPRAARARVHPAQLELAPIVAAHADPEGAPTRSGSAHPCRGHRRSSRGRPRSGGPAPLRPRGRRGHRDAPARRAGRLPQDEAHPNRLVRAHAVTRRRLLARPIPAPPPVTAATPSPGLISHLRSVPI